VYTEDGDFDYGALRREQLEYAIEHIDSRAYPKNLANARAALAARLSGTSPEPPPVLDATTDARYSLWVERVLGLLVALYASITLARNDLVIPTLSRSQIQIIHLHGPAAWLGALGILFVAAIAIVGGLDGSDPPRVRPQFRILSRVALILIAVALLIQVFLKTS